MEEDSSDRSDGSGYFENEGFLGEDDSDEIRNSDDDEEFYEDKNNQNNIQVQQNNFANSNEEESENEIFDNSELSRSLKNITCDAFDWWNEMRIKLGFQSEKTPSQPDIRLSLEIIRLISPLFMLFLTDYMKNSDELWEKVHNIINKLGLDVQSLSCSQRLSLTSSMKFKVPHPYEDFPEFVKSLYAVRVEINPKTTQGIIKIITVHPLRNNINFLLWTFPETLNNSYLYFSVLYDMYRSYNRVWYDFVRTPGAINVFLDHYLSTLGPSHSQATVALIAILESFFKDNLDYMSYPKKQSKFFWKKLMFLIEHSGDAVVVAAFRAAVLLYEIMTPERLAKQYKLEWLNQLVDAAININNPVHNQMLLYVFQIQLPKFKFMTLCKILSKQGFVNPTDVEWIVRAMMIPTIKKPFYGFKFLYSVATYDKVWSTLAIEALATTLIRYHKLEALAAWTTTFIRRAFIFVGVSMIRKKYKIKRSMVLNFFEKMYSLGIEWLSNSIEKYYSSLVATRKLKCLIPSITITSKPDVAFISEIDRISRTALEMKTYLGVPVYYKKHVNNAPRLNQQEYRPLYPLLPHLMQQGQNPNGFHKNKPQQMLKGKQKFQNKPLSIQGNKPPFRAHCHLNTQLQAQQIYDPPTPIIQQRKKNSNNANQLTKVTVPKMRNKPPLLSSASAKPPVRPPRQEKTPNARGVKKVFVTRV